MDDVISLGIHCCFDYHSGDPAELPSALRPMISPLQLPISEGWPSADKRFFQSGSATAARHRLAQELADPPWAGMIRMICPPRGTVAIALLREHSFAAGC